MKLFRYLSSRNQGLFRFLLQSWIWMMFLQLAPDLQGQTQDRVFVDNIPFRGGLIDVDAGLAFSSEDVMERKGGMSHKGVFRIWDLTTGRPTEEFVLPARIFDFCLNREEQRIAIFGGPGNRDETHFFVALFDYGNGRFLYLTPPGRIDGSTTSRVVFGPEPDTVWLGPDPSDRYGNQHDNWYAISGDRANQVHPISKADFQARLETSIDDPGAGLQLLDVLDQDGGIALVKERKRGDGWVEVDHVGIREADTGLPLIQIGDDALPIAGYVISSSGEQFAAWQEDSYSGEKTLLLWDLNEMRFRIYPKLGSLVENKWIESVVLPENGRTANIVFRGERYGAEKEGKDIFRISLEEETEKVVSKLSWVDQVLWDEDQNGALVWRSGEILQYDPGTGETRPFAKARKSEKIVSFSPDRRFFWREFRREDLMTSSRDEDLMRAQGVEMVEAKTRQVVAQLAANSYGIIQNIRVHYAADGCLVGSEVKLATGGYTRSELNWVSYDGEVRGFPIAEPEGAMLIWCGLISSPQGTYACTARSNGILESFDFESGARISSYKDKEIEGWFQHLTLPATIADQERYVLPRKDGGIRVMSVSAEGKPERVADVLISRKNHWLIRSPSGHYWSSPGGERNVMIEIDRGRFPISFLDLAYHRPHVVARDLGAPVETIEELETLWKARLERHGMKADLIPDPLQTGTVEPIDRIPFVAPGRELRIRFQLDSAPLENARLQLLVNEVPAHGRNGIDVSGEIVETSVQLSRGFNEIEAYVVEESGMESIHWRGRTWLSATAASSRKPAIHIFAVGVSDYENDDFDLEFAAKDASDLSARFATLGEENGFREAFVHLVTDRLGTREEILRNARNLQEAEVDDTVIVFFAGHGVVTSSGEYFFGTSDLDFENPQENGISYRDIQSLFDGVAARRRFVFIDTCHAGELEASEVAFIRNDPNLAARGVTVRPLAQNSTPSSNRSGRLIRSFFSDIRLDTGAHVLCAAQGAEFALESDSTQNGLFTHFLLKEIESESADLDGDGNILAPELVNAVAEKVSKLTGGVQNPVMRESNSSLPFSLWPTEGRNIDPEQVLHSYLGLSEKAADMEKRKLAVSYFSPRVRYFGKDLTPDEIDQDMKRYCEQYDSIRYQVNDLKIESQSSEEAVFRYLLHFHVQSELKQDPRTFRSYYEVDRKGSVPSRVVLERDGIGWKIRELGSVR